MYEPIDTSLRVIYLSCAPCFSDPVITPDDQVLAGLHLERRISLNGTECSLQRHTRQILIHDTLLLHAHHGQNSTPVPRNDTVT